MDALSVVRSYLQCYSNMEYRRMAAHTTDEFVYEDPLFIHLEGDTARLMFRMIIDTAPQTLYKVTARDVQPSDDDPENTVIAKYEAESMFDGKTLYTNYISTILTVTEGKICKQVSSYDIAGMAAQLRTFLGIFLGSSYQISRTQTKARQRLNAFIKQLAADKKL